MIGFLSFLLDNLWKLSFLVAEDFKDVFHSLDIWHKAKSIKKCIQKVCGR